MEARELRIGNLISTPYEEVFEVDSFMIQNILYHKLDVKPIPLTEEWLLKFGFEEGKSKWFGKKYFTDFSESVEEMKIDYNVVSNRLAIYDSVEETDMVNILSHPIFTAKRVHYVHQLQNLYFALTGEELTINQPKR